MYENGKYGKLVMYTEANEAGSMFQYSLPDSMNSIYDELICIYWILSSR